MEDLSEKLSALLNSPDGMDKIKAAAKSILGDNFAEENKPAEPKEESVGFSIPEDMLSNIGNMQNIMRLAGLLKGRQDDSRVTLLRALKPHLSSERAMRVDRAISLLRIASILPVLREEGLFESLGL